MSELYFHPPVTQYRNPSTWDPEMIESTEFYLGFSEVYMLMSLPLDSWNLFETWGTT